MLRKNRATNANAHLAQMQAQTLKPMLQLAKELQFCLRTRAKLLLLSFN
jgi:hypothetical protein